MPPRSVFITGPVARSSSKQACAAAYTSHKVARASPSPVVSTFMPIKIGTSSCHLATASGSTERRSGIGGTPGGADGSRLTGPRCVPSRILIAVGLGFRPRVAMCLFRGQKTNANSAARPCPSTSGFARWHFALPTPYPVLPLFRARDRNHRLSRVVFRVWQPWQRHCPFATS